MRNKITIPPNNLASIKKQFKNSLDNKLDLMHSETKLPEILFITTFPPRECGIATYSQDLIFAINNKFTKSFAIKIVALESGNEKHIYADKLYAVLKTDNPKMYVELAEHIDENSNIEIVLIQHEFGLFRNNEADFISFLKLIHKPIIVAFHTVLPNPNDQLKKQVQEINAIVDSFIVMTNSSAKILENNYGVLPEKITIIPHGTHLVEHSNKEVLKRKYELSGRKIISTFGLLSSGKSIETSIDALQAIVKEQPQVLFLIIGKTHPTVFKNEGEKYRNSLEAKIEALGLQNNVKFINQYLPLNELLEYLQLTDIYLFTSKDRNQAVSGTFAYAISCGCPIISTPIPHAMEVLENGTGIIVDFENPKQLAEQVILLLGDEQLRKNIAANGIHKLAPTAWENSAIAHANMFEKISDGNIKLQYKIPEVNLNHFKNLTTPFGMIQFSIINQPDLESGYTLDDNARALVAMCQHFELTNDEGDLEYINQYFNFIKFCFQDDGTFLNYVDKEKKFTKQNNENLDDANGRAIWALGHLISLGEILPTGLYKNAVLTMELALKNVSEMNSTRAVAFIIKGIYYSNLKHHSIQNVLLMQHLANKLVQMYKHEAKDDWQWFESYLTYANSILPEAILCAYLTTGETIYREIAEKSFDFLLSKIYRNNSIRVISNKGWHTNDEELNLEKIGGEQPIDIAYTILALSKFYNVFKDEKYLEKMEIGFSWFLGNNHLHQIIYNPCTGGCYDGLEDKYINLNQGAESTVSYLMARLAIQKQLNQKDGSENIGKIIVSRKSKLKSSARIESGEL
ncbi:Glycosyltransferase involved in cell wall bisynthesis [Flavobacterium fluvii]|uniref:Glycosyltransferase involved in cell wall bisynthesis n=1 Tax=Flavobacterium fluvii TaxID=468056 RepID=A0A1M5KIE6_9FLAO|nr:glycosyltransferase [Flavobacterium fluvii]SHG52400.1 Glycosyltransferase involved in cell wall bisynthesis [Flavobacterium fluvii]